jgi:CubicO group peptidase (beta-lactamase class C family)
MGVSGVDTFWRIVFSDDSSIEDYKRFPIRALSASENPYVFPRSEDSQRLPGTVAVAGQEPIELEKFLTQTDAVAFLVVKDDMILMEEYYSGYAEAIPTLAFSMSKSFTSMLVGVAISEGYIDSIDQFVTEYVPELSDSGFSAVTIEHLLQMTSGMNYVEIEGRPFSRHNRFYYTDNLEAEILDLGLARPPGQAFAYKTGDNALLGLVLSRAIAPKTVTAFTQEWLWEPLGMEFDGGWNVDNPEGLEKTWCCLSGAARDYAKLGRLYLNRGEWNGEQLVPSEWIDVSTMQDVSEGSAWNYQYQWWRISEGSSAYAAMGHLGQFVFIDLQRDTIIVRLGTGRGGFGWDEWMAVLAELSEGITSFPSE